MAIGISPLVDFAFKLVLGSPEHSGITIHFLNSILAGPPRIAQVRILNPFLGNVFATYDASQMNAIADQLQQQLHARNC